MLSYLFSTRPTPLEVAETKLALLRAENERLRRQVQEYKDALSRSEHEVTRWKIRCDKTEESLEQLCVACDSVLQMRDPFMETVNHMLTTMEMNTNFVRNAKKEHEFALSVES